MAKFDTSGKAKNKSMNNDVYKLRREVMKYIYEAKTIVPLPRITIRITETCGHTLGMARMKDNIIWIPENAIQDNYDLRSIVYHEILHAVFGIEHDDTCPLMKPVHTRLSEEEAKSLFKYWATKQE